MIRKDSSLCSEDNRSNDDSGSMVERISPLRFRHAELASRLFEKTEIGDLRDTEGLRDFGVLAYQVEELVPAAVSRSIHHYELYRDHEHD